MPSAIRRCRIVQKAGRPNADWLVGNFNSDLTLGIVMKVNDKAPEFTLPDENGKDVSLKDLRGKIVILFFYPRASTPG
jgi:cytochrome oxidase Cu insertion factor (SCO1/SenC/PrrC family)